MQLNEIRKELRFNGELLNLSKQMEQNAVKRLKSMLELSALRHISLDELMEQLVAHERSF